MSNQSIQRAADILALFSVSRPQLKVSRIAREMGLPVGTVHGLVRSLCETGFLTQDPASREYRLGLSLYLLGTTQVVTLELNQRAAAPMNYLARETGLIVRVGLFERDSVIVTMTTFPLVRVPFGPHAGIVAPAYCTSLGRAILAHLPPEVAAAYLARIRLRPYTPRTITDTDAVRAELDIARAHGYAVVEHEIMADLVSIGAPIFGADGGVLGAICVNGDPDQIPKGAVPVLARRVKETAGEISGALGYSLMAVGLSPS